MSFNGSGLFSINTTGQPVVANTLITAAAFNAFTADIATGLSTAICKDGQTTITANLPMNSHKFTGLAAGSTAGDSIRYEQVVGVYAPLAGAAFTGGITGTTAAFTGIVSCTYSAVYGAATVHTGGPGSGGGFMEWNRSSSAGELTILNYKGGGTGGINFGSVTALNAATTYLTLTDDGRFYGSALHDHAGALTGTTNQYVASGTSATYTPAFSSLVNCSSVSASSVIYTRLGSVVDVSMNASLTVTTGSGTNTSLTVTPPIGSSMASLTGIVLDQNDRVVGNIAASGTSIQANWNPSSSGAHVVTILARYVVT